MLLTIGTLRAFAPVILSTVLASAAFGQYTISTIAGGGSPSGLPNTSVGLSHVTGVAVDATGNIYVSSSQQNRVYKAAPNGILTTVAGSSVPGFSGDNGPAASAQLRSPGGLAVDSNGNLYICDQGNARIRKVSGGNITTVAGNGGFGFSGDNGLAVNAQLVPSGIAIDAGGTIYVADANNYRIRKIQNGIITTVAGNGSSGFSGDNSLATTAQFAYPQGVAVDGNGNLFIADGSNYRVRKVTGGVITTVAGNGTFGFGGDGGTAVSAPLGFVVAVSVDAAGSLYIADASNNMVRKVSSGIISTVAGGGGICGQASNAVGDGCAATNAILSGPSAVAVDIFSNLYIGDSGNYRVRKIVAGVISTVVGNGSFHYSGDNGSAANAQFYPQGVAAASPGNFYIADGLDYRVRYVSGGMITTAAGTGECCYNGDGFAATSARVGNYLDVVMSTGGSFYIPDGLRVRRVAGGIITTVAGNGTFGFSGDGGPATSANMSLTRSAAVDSAGNLYIADPSNGRVRKVSNGLISTVAGGGPVSGSIAAAVSLGQTSGVTADAAGNLFIADTTGHRIYRVSTGGVLTIIAGNGSPGFSGDGGNPTAAQLNNPYGVAVNSAGTVVFISDRGNSRVRMISSGIISTVAGGGFGCPAQTNPVGDNCPGTAATLYYPSVIKVDATGADLYISDALNYRIRKLSGGIITTVAGNGLCCYEGDGGAAISARLNYATGLALDPANGDIYIGDSENFRIRKVSGGIITTVAGTGNNGYSGDGGDPAAAQLSYPYGVAVDGSGNLYIADAGNHRVRKVAGGAITTIAGSGAPPGFSGDGGPATSAILHTPYDVALDGAGKLYIADTANQRIRMVSNGTITTVAGNGNTKFSGDGGPATSAQLNNPQSLAVDGNGNLYISDSYRIRRVAPGGTITTIAGTGICCYSGDGGPASSAEIGSGYLAADTAGALYLADSISNRIRKISAGAITTIAGNGTYGYSGDGGPATNATLGNPQGIALDTAGNIYIADAGNFAIRLLTTSPRAITSITPTSVTAGSAQFTLQVNGTGFVPGDTILWNGTALNTTFGGGGILAAPVTADLVSQPGTGVVTVNGLSNSISLPIQACSYLLDANNSSVGFGSGTGALSVTTQGTCSWTAVSSALWLNVTQGSGTGNGTVNYSFAANPNGTARTATIRVGNQIFTLTQAGINITGQGLRFVPIAPCRIADTRLAAGPYGGPVMAAAIARDFDITSSVCGIPSNALAYSLNITAVPVAGLGFLSIWPAGQSQPVVSTLNSPDGRIRANAAIVPAGVNGAITLFASRNTNAIVDINGYFVLASAGQNLAYYPITPCRLADTRIGTGTFAGPALAAASTRIFPVLSGPCGVPASAQAYATNMTVVPNQPVGFLSAWPAGMPQPGSSTLNAPTGKITANMAIVPAGVGGAIAVIATHPTELIIDIMGYFAPPGPGSLDFYTVTPCRIADTRDPAGEFGAPALAAAQARSFTVPASACSVPAGAQAFSLNATVVPPAPLGFLSLWGSGGQPTVSTLNSGDGTIVANAALVTAGTGGVVTAFASHQSHLILDINGYFR